MTVFLILIIAIAVVGGCMAGQYNRLVSLDQRVKSQWAQVDTVLQRRADLVPNLVETVKGYVKHEQEVFRMITDARKALMGARTPSEAGRANEMLSSALSRLLALVENNPQLRANENFLRLQDELAGTENRIAVERRRYNLVVEEYNRVVQGFPTIFFARIFNFPMKHDYFQAEEGARAAPRVRF
jgi:LemA protein